jgi:cobalt-zinc-cadmium efflux system protein
MRIGSLVAALAVSLVVAVAEIAGGIRAQSLGLVADAVHAGTDALAISVMLTASFLALRPANRRKTFGYGRIEVLGAVFNGALLLGITALIAYGAVQRFAHPLHPQGLLMAIVSVFALCGNLIAGYLLAQSARANLGVRGALLHVGSDAMGSFAVMIGGLFIAWTHHAWIDPMLSLIVCAIVVAGVLQMLREALDILLEAVPRGIDAHAVEQAILSCSGVAEVHELHIWTIGAGAHALSAHVFLAEGADAPRALDAVRMLLRERYGITHVTVQMEREHCNPEGEAVCVPLEKPSA